MNGCTGDLIQQCQWGCSAGRCNGVPAPVATLKAVPSLVKQGKTTQVSWSTNNVTACSVTSTNDDSWNALSSTGTTSNPITSQTIFTLRCQGYAGATPGTITKSVTVSVSPSWVEQ